MSQTELFCKNCGNEINFNEPYFSLNLHQEVMPDIETIYVVKAYSVQRFCNSCSKIHNFDEIKIPLHAK